MSRYHITTWRSPHNPYPFCYLETAHLVKVCIEDLGLDVTQEENRIDPSRVNILFNWHEWPGPQHPVSIIRNNQCIIYQSEQILHGGRRLPDWYYQSLIETDAVWDYSLDHISTLQHNNVRVSHVPPGFHDKAIKIATAEKKEVDILFYGCKNIRRDFMCKLLSGLFNLKWLDLIYGADRDREIAKARLVLNVHYYSTHTLELLRLSHLLTNGIPVISEDIPTGAHNPYGDGIYMTSYRNLPKAIMGHLNNPYRLNELGKSGKEAIQKHSMVDTVRTALITGGFEPASLKYPLISETKQLLLND